MTEHRAPGPGVASLQLAKQLARNEENVMRVLSFSDLQWRAIALVVTGCLTVGCGDSVTLDSGGTEAGTVVIVDAGGAGDDTSLPSSNGDDQPDGTTGNPAQDAGPPVACVAGHDPKTFGATCCTTGNARCVPAADVPSNTVADFTACTEGSGGAGLCVPDKIIASGTAFAPATCASLANAPGVCLSKCIGVVAGDPNVALLKQATCDADELCVPCMNPITQKPTGACDLHGVPCTGDASAPGPDAAAFDAGPACPYTGPPILDPTTFPACTPTCGGAHCVPSALVPPAEQAQLMKCGTGATAGFCTPDPFIASLGNGLPPTCKSVAGAEGRCLSDCLPAVQAKLLVLPRATCAADERCAPCFDPTATNPKAPTGACSVACDVAKDPPTILSCPYTGPPILDPTVFPACTPACGGSHCVPAAFVPAAEQAQLATCGAGASAGFCAPDSFTSSGGKAVPASCTSVAGSEGRCLSTCLPSVAAKATLLPKSTCATGELCAPCFDPTAANPKAPTGACSIACDAPKRPPTILTCPYSGPPVIDPNTFPACAPACGGAHCVPSALVPPAQQSQLASCPGGFCTPDPIVASDNNYVPPACQPFDDPASEGRCTSDCLPGVQAKAGELSQANCASNALCAPCDDPFTGVSTGACRVGCDAPTKPKFTFPLCCNFNGGAQGTCVPTSLVPSGQQSRLLQDECPGNAANYLCVPNEYLPTPPIPVSTCHALLGPGTCISQCVTIPFSGVFAQRDCPDNHLCVACSIAGSTTPGCQ